MQLTHPCDCLSLSENLTKNQSNWMELAKEVGQELKWLRDKRKAVMGCCAHLHPDVAAFV